MDKQLAKKILDHLTKHNIWFVYLPNGQFVTDIDCIKLLERED